MVYQDVYGDLCCLQCGAVVLYAAAATAYQDNDGRGYAPADPQELRRARAA